MNSILADLDVLLNKINSEATKQHAILSDADRQINDLYHIIEYIPLSGIEKVKVFNLLRKRLTDRRGAKESIADFDRIKERLKGVKDSNRSIRESKYRREATEALNKIRQVEKW